MHPVRTTATRIYTRCAPVATLPTATTRAFHAAPALQPPTLQVEHSMDAYNKDVDMTPPKDKTMYHVDPEAPVQRATAPPSGEWSRAGMQTIQYAHVDKKNKHYAAPGQPQRYGNMDVLAKKQAQETSRPNEGPEGKSSSGRKPEKKKRE
ncbi:hypothetical protein AX15_000529 [Amanita polypyramis BW_CC]|nr:hypothetical protein AX15_000529 [Amanita polypyramis BW_CC]